MHAPVKSGIYSQTIVLSCALFLFFLFLLPTHPLEMFADPDTAWHIATGDLIRAQGHVLAHDPWSFTAGQMPWINTAWAWDVAASWLHAHFGWQGVIALNSITFAAAMAAIFAACFLRSRDGMAAFVASLAALLAMIIYLHARPVQLSFLLAALLSLLLSQVARGACSPRWLLIVPLLVVAWVNLHGGFLIAFSLLGLHGIAAILQQRRPLLGWLLVSGALSLLACLCNPYGAGIFDVTLRLMTSPINAVTSEWQPLAFSMSHVTLYAYLLLFLALAMMRPLAALPVERWIAYFWLAMAMLSVRHVNVFVAVSAPLLAMGLHGGMQRRQAAPPALPPAVEKLCALTTGFVSSRAGVAIALLLALAAAFWMLTPQAARLYGTQALKPFPDLSPDIAFIETHYPQARLLDDFGLGGYLIYEAGGKIPLFIDGRMEGAYPRDVTKDYVAFHTAEKGWEAMLDRWKIDGLLLSPSNPVMMDRFSARRGWYKAFESRNAVLFLRMKDTRQGR